MASQEGHNITIGYSMKKKKFDACKFDRVLNLAGERGMKVVEIDFEDPHLPKEQNVDIIVAKLTDVLVDQQKQENIQIAERWRNFEKQNPQVILIDAIAAQDLVTDRIKSCQLLDEVHKATRDEGKKAVSPGWAIFENKSDLNAQSLASRGIHFPVMCKTTNACGSSQSHQMGLVLNEKGLQEFNTPVLVQEFYNHNSVIFKVFVVGESLQIVSRTSLQDIDLGSLESSSNFSFNSQGFNKNFDASNAPTLSPDQAKKDVPFIAKAIQKHAHLNMFGFDVIRHRQNGRSDEEVLSVIDVNFFPGYLGMDSFPSDVLSLCQCLCEQKQSSQKG